MKVSTRAKRLAVVGTVAVGVLGLGVGSAFAVSDIGPGSTDTAGVKCVQQGLDFFGYGLAVDGSYGSLTTAAVEKFQSTYGDSVDGIVGPQTGHSLITEIEDLIVALHHAGESATAETTWVSNCSGQIPNS
ncbi:peptidoglycan-binding protein [Actinospica durhamensis]|uniref:Peptidoglycan-binding protein n=1 Tax=Actinospica durhamensis TaxID=1508375 RepID=A0A941IUU0_9ACTN|nr:peptidoglycan-binding domain-containing protein [Actinospica durhamensis]MBR7839622.1 peptidoglycan-binding protein [Actinospica durhamensis]